MQYHEGQREYCSSYLAQKWQMLVENYSFNQVHLIQIQAIVSLHSTLQE